jgi:segregation and condensation protein B
MENNHTTQETIADTADAMGAETVEAPDAGAADAATSVESSPGPDQPVDEATLNEEASRELEALLAEEESAAAMDAEVPDDGPIASPQSDTERSAIIEALIFVSEEPLSAKTLAEVLKLDKAVVEESLSTLAEQFNARQSGLQLREVAGGWQFATRPEFHEHVRAFLKTRPSAKLSIASLETLAVIAYRQPITVPEILDIRGVQSPSAIKTLLDKKLIVAKGRKDTVGRPMMYGTSKEFLLQFGLKDLTELPSVEDFHDLSGGAE